MIFDPTKKFPLKLLLKLDYEPMFCTPMLLVRDTILTYEKKR